MGSPPQTNVPFPNFGPNGTVLPTEPQILTGVQADWQIAFASQGTLNFSTTGGSQTNPTPQGQLTASETAVIGENFAMFAWYISQVDPAFSTGRMQDGIGRIYFIARIAGQPTVQPCICNGAQGVPIPVGLLFTDNNNNQWIASQGGTIPSGGSITLNFQCTVDGPTVGPTSVTSFQGVPGLDSITPTGDAVLGNFVESASQFEARRSLSTGKNSQGPINSIYANVAEVPGVLDLYTYSNDTNSPVTIGGVTINANGVYLAVLGGNSNAVARAAWGGKMPGAPWYTSGNTTVAVTDPNPAYLPPAPTYSVIYETVSVQAFAVVVVLKNNAGIPSNALALIQNAIIAAFAGLDGGSRAKIGSTVFASRYYAGVMALGSWAQIIDIQLGLNGAAASFTGSITGTALTVSGVTGTIAVGQLLQDTTGMITNGTTIISGSGTSWVVSISQSVTSEAMTTTTLANDVTVNINQAPGVSAANIALILV